MKIQPYLMFNGNCEEAFKFYEKTFKGKIENLTTFAGSPMAANTAPGWEKKILHVSLSVGEEVIMGSDAPPGHFEKPQGFSVALSINDPGEATRVFQALTESGDVKMPIQKTFWASLFGMCVDRFGIPWFVSCN